MYSPPADKRTAISRWRGQPPGMLLLLLLQEEDPNPQTIPRVALIHSDDR
jgi:hypothetical protein